MGYALPKSWGGPNGESGISLGGDTLIIPSYILNTVYVNISDTDWITKVENGPVYMWFIAIETSMFAHCGNDTLPKRLGKLVFYLVKRGCTKFNLEDEIRTEQHFVKMWYDIIINLEGFLDITQGLSDPYTWTSGEGCGYDLKGTRGSYSGEIEITILKLVSNELYYLDEGSSLGALDKYLLMGGIEPVINKVSPENLFKTNSSIQTIYLSLHSRLIPERVRNYN